VVVLGQAGDSVVGVAPQVVRNQLGGGVGPASAAPDAGASISVFDRRGPSLQRGKGPAEVDCPQGLATAVQDVRGDPAVTPPTLQHAARYRSAAVGDGGSGAGLVVDQRSAERDVDLHRHLLAAAAQAVLEVTAEQRVERVVHPLPARPRPVQRADLSRVREVHPALAASRAVPTASRPERTGVGIPRIDALRPQRSRGRGVQPVGRVAVEL